MRKERNELMGFVGGFAMLITGLFLFSQKVSVSNSFFGGGFMIGGVNLTGGMIVIPFIIAIVWLFVNPDSIGAKILTVLGVGFIIGSIILSTNMRLKSISLFEWILMLVLTFGGLGLVARVLFAGRKSVRESKTIVETDEYKRIEKKQRDLEEELEALKRNQ